MWGIQLQGTAQLASTEQKIEVGHLHDMHSVSSCLSRHLTKARQSFYQVPGLKLLRLEEEEDVKMRRDSLQNMLSVSTETLDLLLVLPHLLHAPDLQ